MLMSRNPNTRQERPREVCRVCLGVGLIGTVPATLGEQVSALRRGEVCFCACEFGTSQRVLLSQFADLEPVGPPLYLVLRGDGTVDRCDSLEMARAEAGKCRGYVFYRQDAEVTFR